MTEVNIFEMATRAGLRFEYKGFIGVEDLWDLSLEALNSIYKSLKASVKQSEEGLLNTRNVADRELDLKIEVVKRVFEVKQEELSEKKLAAAKRQKKEKLMDVLERKQNQELESLPASEIEKMINEL